MFQMHEMTLGFLTMAVDNAPGMTTPACLATAPLMLPLPSARQGYIHQSLDCRRVINILTRRVICFLS